MDEFGRCHVPAFGSWNGSDDLQFSECFEATRQVGLFPCYGDRDLYVTRDLYAYDLRTPTVIVVPRTRRKSRNPNVVEAKRGDCVSDVKELPSPVLSISLKKAYKPVDEDLYKISPEFLYSNKPKRKRGWGIFSRCCIAMCDA